MDFTILAIGRCRDKPVLDLCAFYQGRLKPYAPTTVVELTPRSTNRPARAQEAALLLEKIPPDALCIALDEKGQHMTTAQFADTLTHYQNQAFRQVYFIIGGADGLDESVRQRAQLVWSLSKLTFPHMLVRPILLEQLYRACSLNAGHPYHREG